MQSYYEIGVSLNGKPFFTTAPHSLTTREATEKVYTIMKRKFPKSEGYQLTAIYWNCRGDIVDETRHDSTTEMTNG